MGALTNKPMAFNSRNWEYSSLITNDLTDFLTPRIRVDQFSGKVYRILPTVDWISNKIRFLYLGLRNQRVISPLFSYKFSLKIELTEKIITLNKLLILTNRFEKIFLLLKKRIANNRKKNLNILLGSVFTSNCNFLDHFEKRNTKVKKFLEFTGAVNLSKFSFAEANYIFFGVNPRMESPLLNIKIKESQKTVITIGSFSFQYNVSVVDNSNFSLLKALQGKILENAIALFGINTISLFDNYSGKKGLLVPIYYLNNLVKNYSNDKKNVSYLDDFNLYLSPQNISEIRSNLVAVITTHFEKLKGSDKAIRIPVSGYLESNFNYLDKDLELKRISSVKPGFGLSDFITAFSLYTKKNTQLVKGFQKRFKFKIRVVNGLVSSTVPNYLVRDPLTRANQLFNKS